MVSRISFSSIQQIWYVEVRIARSISESPLEFEINESRLYRVCFVITCSFFVWCFMKAGLRDWHFMGIFTHTFYYFLLDSFWKTSVRFDEFSIKKKVREKSGECLNHKPQPYPDINRKRKPINPNKHKSNKRTKSTKISSLFHKRGNRNTKRTEKHKNKMTHGKTHNKSHRRKNCKATKSKTNTRTTLERSVE